MALVSVACKLPHGIHADVHNSTGVLLKRITLNGTNGAVVVGGFGITEGVDKDHIEAWLKMHAESPMVKNGLIFINERVDEVKARAKGQKDQKNGFEGVDPKKPGEGLKPEDEVKLEKQLDKAQELGHGNKK